MPFSKELKALLCPCIELLTSRCGVYTPCRCVGPALNVAYLCLSDVSHSCRWLTLMTGGASLAPWWRSVLTGRTVRRRGLWSWLHRAGLQTKAEGIRDRVCFRWSHCSMCTHFSFVSLCTVSVWSKQGHAFIVFLHLRSCKCRLSVNG